MEKKTGYDQGIQNAGAQEVPAMKKAERRRGKRRAVRGRDLRSGK